jgi:uncharacterized protein
MVMEGVQTDWDKYVGLWYEKVRIPSWFESESLSNCFALYTQQKDGKIQVSNVGIESVGGLEVPVVVNGTANLEKNRVGTLTVSFFPGVSSDYVVLDHDGDDYQFAIVGSSSYKYLWLLSRDPAFVLTKDRWNHMLHVAKAAGYAQKTLDRLQATP